MASPSGAKQEASFWASLKVAVFANFYFAIEASNLVVELGNGEVIDSSSLRAMFENDILKTPETLEGLSDVVLGALESSKTIHSDSGPAKIQKPLCQRLSEK